MVNARELWGSAVIRSMTINDLVKTKQKNRPHGSEAAEDFNENFCCGEQWGLTGNPACWNEELTVTGCQPVFLIL